MYFRTRPAGTGIAHGPEVVFLPHPHDSAFRQIFHLIPEGKSLVIVLKDGHPEFLRRNTQLHGEKLPGKTDSLFLEIIAEGKIPEHFKKGVMTGSVSNVLKVVVLATGPNTTLTGNRPDIIPFVLTHEHGLELHHSGIGEKEGWIVFGDEGGTVDGRMAILDKIV
ncbi:MAG: hypothetical protein ACD_75C02449G0002 [uncultured bacterium]|nr:MAG: hypothetical protein ACD_75C02449G0002 [uncultured bacterium]